MSERTVPVPDDALVAAPGGPHAPPSDAVLAVPDAPPSSGVGGTGPSSPNPPAVDRRGLYAAMAVTVLVWASAFVVIRDVGDVVSPGALTLGRLVVGTIALGVVVLLQRAPWPARLPWWRLAGMGVLWFGVYNVALNAAEQRVDAGTAAMLVNISPVLLALLAGFALREGFPRALIVGSLLGLAGTTTIGVATSTGLDADVLGVVLCLVSALAYCVAVVLQKPLLSQMTGLQVTWVACAMGMVACLPFAPRLVDDLQAAGTSSALGVLYLGLFPTAIGFATWAYVLKRSSAGQAGATTYLVPPIAVLLGWLLLDEVPPLLALLGGALCLVGVAVTRRAKR